MLASLSIRDIVIIDRLDIAFAPGLSVLTGETGAGKSILLDAFALALGARGDASLVRQGAEQGQVSAAFELASGHPAHELLHAHGLDSEGAVILRRVQSADGRSRAFINDQAASVQLLRSLGTLLVEIHGQHDDRALIDPDAHRRLLDAFGGLEPGAAEVAALWRAWCDAEHALEAAQEALSRSESERAYLAHAVEELDKLAPQTGEEADLADRRHLMMEAEKLAEELSEALQTVSGQASPAPLMAAALRRLERRAERFPDLLGPVVTAFDQALTGIEEVRAAAEAALASTAFDPGELEMTEERLFALRAAARKHRITVDELPEAHARLAGELAAIDESGARTAELELAARAAKSRYDEACATLGAQRRETAMALDEAVSAELAPLKLERARFTTRIDPLDTPGPNGAERVEFWVETNPGSRPGPLAKVASGGELARFLLALKVALAERGSAPTLVFDEIDTAVGGAVADAIGARLARLAKDVQVLSITHAPQVAARADAHLLIAKQSADTETERDRVATRVEHLDAGRRREEVARMLAGATVTDEARAAAARLIAEA